MHEKGLNTTLNYLTQLNTLQKYRGGFKQPFSIKPILNYNLGN